MRLEQATQVRKEWSAACDTVVHQKPMFIKRTRDRIWMSSAETMSELLSAYRFTAKKFVESDGSVTLSLNELDLVENGRDEAEAREALGRAVLDYANEFYEEYDLYSHAPNRKAHIPYVFKALLADDAAEIGRAIVCRSGKN